MVSLLNNTMALDSEILTYAVSHSANISVAITTSDIPTTLSPTAIILPKLYFWVFGVVLCVLSTVGVVTNVLNIYALTLTVRTNKRPMYHCLICMAVVDMLVSFYVQGVVNRCV